MKFNTNTKIEQVDVDDFESEVEDSVLEDGDGVPDSQVLDEVDAGGLWEIGCSDVTQVVAHQPKCRYQQSHYFQSMRSEFPGRRSVFIIWHLRSYVGHKNCVHLYLAILKCA